MDRLSMCAQYHIDTDTIDDFIHIMQQSRDGVMPRADVEQHVVTGAEGEAVNTRMPNRSVRAETPEAPTTGRYERVMHARICMHVCMYGCMDVMYAM